MSTLFQSYEEEYRDAVKSIRDGLAALRATLSATSATSSDGGRSQRAASLLAHARRVAELLSNMEYESRDAAPAQRPALKERLAEYRENARALEEDIEKARSEAAAADRRDLVGNAAKREAEKGASGEIDDETARHREHMMQNTEKVKQASNTLTRAERLLNNTEDIGADALQNLRTQTETLQHIHGTTVDVNEDITEARKIINQMQRTMLKHKVMLIGIIIALLVLIFLAIFISVQKHNSMKPVVPTQEAIPAPPLPSFKPNDKGGIPSD